MMFKPLGCGNQVGSALMAVLSSIVVLGSIGVGVLRYMEFAQKVFHSEFKESRIDFLKGTLDRVLKDSLLCSQVFNAGANGEFWKTPGGGQARQVDLHFDNMDSNKFDLLRRGEPASTNSKWMPYLVGFQVTGIVFDQNPTSLGSNQYSSTLYLTLQNTQPGDPTRVVANSPTKLLKFKVKFIDVGGGANKIASCINSTTSVAITGSCPADPVTGQQQVVTSIGSDGVVQCSTPHINVYMHCPVGTYLNGYDFTSTPDPAAPAGTTGRALCNAIQPLVGCDPARAANGYRLKGFDATGKAVCGV